MTPKGELVRQFADGEADCGARRRGERFCAASSRTGVETEVARPLLSEWPRRHERAGRKEDAMKINVKRIPEGGETLRGTESAAILDLDDPNVRFEKEIEYELHAQMRGNALLVTGTLRTPATLRCGRCLKIAQTAARGPDFVFHHELHGEDFVDLTENIREDILLQLPQRTLCNPDCKGLCPVWPGFECPPLLVRAAPKAFGAVERWTN